MIESCGFATASSQAPSSCSPTTGAEERIGREKAGKLMGLDKESLMGKTKDSTQGKKNKSLIPCFQRTGRCSAISRMVMVTWEDNLHH